MGVKPRGGHAPLRGGPETAKITGMRTMFFSLTAALAISAGAFCLGRSQNRPGVIVENSERGSVKLDATATGKATARELDRLQRVQQIQNEIDRAKVELAWAEALEKDWQDATVGKPMSQSESEMLAANIAKAKDARARLENLQAEAARLVAAK